LARLIIESTHMTSPHTTEYTPLQSSIRRITCFVLLVLSALTFECQAAELDVHVISYAIDTFDQKYIKTDIAGSKTKLLSPLPYFRAQADLMVTAVEKGMAELRKVGASSNTKESSTLESSLVIFMAPEFFFKYYAKHEVTLPDGSGRTIQKQIEGGPYKRTDMIEGLEYLKKKLPKEPQLLVLPGTVWWWEPSGNKEKPVRIHNTMPVMCGGKIIHTWQKTNLSNIDGLNDTAEEWDRDNVKVRAVLDKTQNPVFPFTIAGRTVRVGVEVCLDHHSELAVLKNAVADQRVDIHALAACGMGAEQSSIAAHASGLFIRCDGAGGRPEHDCWKYDRGRKFWSAVPNTRQVKLGSGVVYATKTSIVIP